MTLSDNIQYIIERVADGEGNLPEVIAEAKMVLEGQRKEKVIIDEYFRTFIKERLSRQIDDPL